MKARAIALTVALCFIVGSLCFAASDPNIGSWKLNEAKSKFSPGAVKTGSTNDNPQLAATSSSETAATTILQTRR